MQVHHRHDPNAVRFIQIDHCKRETLGQVRARRRIKLPKADLELP